MAAEQLYQSTFLHHATIFARVAHSKQHITHVLAVLVIDKKGVVRYAHSGYPGNKAVIAAVRKA